jgi:hypothetical protein
VGNGNLTLRSGDSERWSPALSIWPIYKISVSNLLISIWANARHNVLWHILGCSGFWPCYGPYCRVTWTARNTPKLQPSLAGLISSLLPYLLPLQLVSDSIIYLLLWYSLGLARSANGYTTRWLTSVFIAFSKSLADFWKKLSLILFLCRISASFYTFLSTGFAKIGSFASPRQISCFEVHQNSYYSPSGGTM